MFYYILDPKDVSPDKFERFAVMLSGVLAEFGILGEMAKVSPLRRIPDLVEIASGRGVRTLVVCGSDDTFNQVLASVKGKPFVLAFIPMFTGSTLANIFGIPDMLSAVKAISSRRVEMIDVARIENSLFVSYLEFGVLSQWYKPVGWWQFFKLTSYPKFEFTFRVDDMYNMTVSCVGGLVLNARGSANEDPVVVPTDGQLELIILEEIGKNFILKYREAFATQRLELIPGSTVIKCRTLEIISPQNQPITMLGRLINKTPVSIGIKESKLKLVVGRDRKF